MSKAEVIYQFYRLKQYFGRTYAIGILRTAERRYLMCHNDVLQSIYCQVLWDIRDGLI